MVVMVLGYLRLLVVMVFLVDRIDIMLVAVAVVV
jgi:hypothetical protein